MATSTHRRSAPRREASIAAADGRGAELALTVEQQEYLVANGFGPGVSTDFSDPDVRARLVRVLRECGVLSSDGSARRRPSRLRRHRLRAG